MARIRTIKPEFFLDDELAELPPLARLLFVGLWTIADKAGRLKDKPVRIKTQVLPYDDCDCDELLDALAEAGFIVRYEADDQRLIEVVNFAAHQRFTNESESKLPALCEDYVSPSIAVTHGKEGKGKEGKGSDTPHSRRNLPSCLSTDSWAIGSGEFKSSAGHILAAIEGKHGLVAPADIGIIGNALTTTCPEGCTGSCAASCAEFVIAKIQAAHTLKTAADWIAKDRGGQT